MKNILITGGAGYVGSQISKTLVSKGYNVTVYDSFIFNQFSMIEYLKSFGCKIINDDISNFKSYISKLGNIDTIIHLAAIVGDPATKKYPEITRNTNIKNTIDLIDCVESSDISKFIFFSTCSNYGKMQNPKYLLNEESELKPLSLYAESKVYIERYLKESNLDTDFTILRMATVFGLSNRMRFDLTVNHFTAEMYHNKKIEVFDPDTWRPYIYVKDIPHVIDYVLRNSDFFKNDVFNIGNDKNNFTKRMIVDLIIANLDFDTDIIFKQINSDDPRDYKVSFKKIQNLGLNCNTSVEEGIIELIDNFKLHKYLDWNLAKYKNN
tara:strand:- start:2174 stop:3142 length:969 start_codon:yes stop_codon:yes gene_type:complete